MDCGIKGLFVGIVLYNYFMKIIEIIENRKKYLLINREKYEKDYVFEKLNQKKEVIGLALTTGFLQTYKNKELKKDIFKKWQIVGIFDIGSIGNPFSSVKFNLLVLQKKKPKEVLFTEYLSENTFISNKKGNLLYEKIGEQVITKDFERYIKNLETIIRGKVPENKENFKFWKIKFSELNLDNLRSNFYDPDLVKNEKKLEKEETDILENLVDIIKPKKLKDKKEGFIIKTKDFKYPLEKFKLKKENITSVELKKGDILLSESFSGNNKFYLINKEYSKPKLYASSFLTVLRPKSEKISSEYLFLYLQSKVVLKYFHRYTTGGFFPKILIKNFRNLPIILPTISTQNKTKILFKYLFLTPKESIEDEINKKLFSESSENTVIQDSFVKENQESLLKKFFYVEDKYFQIYKIVYLKLFNFKCNINDFEKVFRENCSFEIHTKESANELNKFLDPVNIEDFNDRKILALFDFDSAYNQFKGLNQKWGKIKGKEKDGLYRIRSENLK